MELTDELVDINRRIEYMLFNEMLLSKIAYWILSAACLVFFSIALYKLIRGRWSSAYLICICAATFAWSLCSLLALYVAFPDLRDFLVTIRYIGLIPVPALMTMHINSQVSYKRLRPSMVTFFIAIPVLLIFFMCRDLFFPEIVPILPPVINSSVHMFIFNLYAIIALIKSYLLCFNVFYQMPSRARRSTRATIVGVIAMTFLLIGYAIWNLSFADTLMQGVVFELLLPLAPPVALAAFIYPLFDAMYVMPAADVIVTSREFVMKGLNTTVLVLNRRHQILDWNRKDWNVGFPLLRPIYKEHYPAYLKRVLGQSFGKVSPHNTDVLIMQKNGVEAHFLLLVHEVGSNKAMYGYVVEISEVTPIYRKLRYFEEIAHLDTLTGLNNRNAYIDQMQYILKPENMPLLVLVGDLNRLKRVNDVFGHLAGDQLIKHASEAIDKVKPENAFLARVGGDEFVVLIPNGSAEQAEQFIKDARMACGAVQHDPIQTPSVSWGYALMTSMEQSYNDVFTQADSMMYEFKKERAEFTSSGIIPKD